MTDAAAPPTPRDATTVILLRSLSGDDNDRFELFMVKRHGKSAFMANAYVYPGGRLDDADRDPALVEHCTGLDTVALTGVDDPDRARALLLAGVREAFEEAGVLLAHPRGDQARAPVAFSHDVERTAVLDDWRRRLHDGQASLLDLARDLQLAFALDWLYPFAHWITPVVEPRRYDTWFVVALCPAGQDLVHDQHETVDSAWLPPDEALARYERGELQLAPPTLRTLEELRDLATIPAVLARCQSQPVTAILPHFATLDEALVLLLPGDPDYPDPSAEPVRGPTRIVMRDGRWWSSGAS